MKLEKITHASRRHYADACGTAHALDLIGERWALLVMRELMLGPRRFGDLRNSLPGISANVLTQRLEGLEAAGVVRRRRLPPPASVRVYELTDWGRDAEPIILALGRWGARSPSQDVTLPLSAVSMALSFRAMFSPVKARGVQARIGFQIADDAFSFTVLDGTLSTERGLLPDVEAVLSGPAGAMTGAVYRFWDLAELEREGVVCLRGDRAAFARFASVFELPPKAAAGAWTLPKIPVSGPNSDC